MSYQCLLYTVENRIATMTLNRPDRLNALGDTLREDLLDALGKAGADPEVAVIVITGAGRGFCSGGDVKSVNVTKRGRPPRSSRSFSRSGTNVCWRCATARSPSSPP